ncbi:hypothetical protein PYW08_003266 [Mythimna loreyi]|uniref:Uncharacterized protein n=1 Tax=Mythimna loreyi TaxID=667449 RepID=A0ACC2QTA4_9NEOP|nr:hypothetical protein PYW08_003266 [Mythimna loreyi]
MVEVVQAMPPPHALPCGPQCGTYCTPTCYHNNREINQYYPQQPPPHYPPPPHHHPHHPPPPQHHYPHHPPPPHNPPPQYFEYGVQPFITKGRNCTYKLCRLPTLVLAGCCAGPSARQAAITTVLG